jgi:hypothetical protein
MTLERNAVRLMVAAGLLMLGASPSSAQDFQVLSYEGTVSLAIPLVPDLSSTLGTTARACVVYDRSVPQDGDTQGNPNNSNFTGATVQMRIELPAIGVDALFEPVLEDLGVVINDQDFGGVAFLDQVAFVSDSPVNAPEFDGFAIVGGELGVSETGLTGLPDLVTTADSLPLAPLDLQGRGSSSSPPPWPSTTTPRRSSPCRRSRPSHCPRARRRARSRPPVSDSEPRWPRSARCAPAGPARAVPPPVPALPTTRRCRTASARSSPQSRQLEPDALHDEAQEARNGPL